MMFKKKIILKKILKKSIRLDIDGRAKWWIAYPHPYLRVRGELVPTLTVSQVYKYLGVDISPQSTKATVAETPKQGLSNISKAPLKPQQRLYIASCHLVPMIITSAYFNTVIFQVLAMARSTDAICC